MGNSRRERLTLLAADSFAMVTFSTAIGLVSEMAIAGMDFPNSSYARIMAVPANLLTARPYGVFRDWLMRVADATKGGRVRKAVVDVAAFTIFQVPLYAAILASSGATWTQIASACASATVLCAFTGRPYGAYLDWCRKIMGARANP